MTLEACYAADNCCLLSKQTSFDLRCDCHLVLYPDNNNSIYFFHSTKSCSWQKIVCFSKFVICKSASFYVLTSIYLQRRRLAYNPAHESRPEWVRLCCIAARLRHHTTCAAVSCRQTRLSRPVIMVSGLWRELLMYGLFRLCDIHTFLFSHVVVTSSTVFIGLFLLDCIIHRNQLRLVKTEGGN